MSFYLLKELNSLCRDNVGFADTVPQKSTLSNRKILLRRSENLLPDSVGIAMDFAIKLPELESWRS